MFIFNGRAAKTWIARARTRRNELTFLRKLARETDSRIIIGQSFVGVRRREQEIRISQKNLVYAQDLIRDFDYYFNAVVPQRKGGIEIVDYSHASVHTMTTDGTRFWFPELAEPMATTKIYLEHAALQPGQIVFDLGAYAGGATYHFSHAVGSGGHVYAFEPDPRNYDCLLKNLSLHHLSNVTPYRLGIWSESGRVIFQAEGSMGSAIAEASNRSSETKEWIDVVSLSDFCAANHIRHVDFLKMDVEGSEASILGAAGEFLAMCRPSILVEVHHVQGVRSDTDVTRILKAHGYSVEILEQAALSLPLLFARPN